MQRTIMQRTVMFVTAVTTLLGFAPAVAAQSTSPSPAEILGVQERSIQKNFKSDRTTVSEQSQVSGGTPSRQLTLYQLDRNTRVLIGPVRGANQSGEFSGNAQTGDNRLQLLRDLEE